MPTVILIGLRGSGKTTVARLLGERLGCAWVDLDDVTPGVMGHQRVAEAWKAAGEPAFRLAEAAALKAIMKGPDAVGVIALGGGTPTAPGAGAMLAAEQSAGRVVVVYLRAPSSVLRERLERADNSGRPPLTGPGADVLAEIDQVLGARDSTYRTLAKHIVETGTMMPEQVALHVANLTAGNRPPSCGVSP